VGQKTAQRLAFAILRNDAARANALAQAITEVKARIRHCGRCFGYAEAELCAVCADARRDASVLCVVEQAGDIYVIERSGVYRGLYHVLQGAISPLDGIGPDQLRIRELVARLETQPVAELILATNPSMQGEATALHLSRILDGKAGRITRLARGMPVGANLEYTYDVTLNQAFAGRQVFGGG
jgi:recombination protein RecR